MDPHPERRRERPNETSATEGGFKQILKAVRLKVPIPADFLQR